MSSSLSPYPKGHNPNDWHRPNTTTNPAKTLESFFNDMFFLGFNDQLTRWNSLNYVGSTAVAKFPPYNLLKIDEDTYKIEMAVAGYSKDDISITVERDQLLVASKEKRETEADSVVYQGIAQRQWTQKFILGEFMEVTAAVLKDGLLTITIERNLPEEAKPKVIKIK